MTGEPAPDLRRAAACPACGGGDIHPWRTGTFDPARLDASTVRITDSGYGLVWDLGRCRSCGHIFADPSPAPELVDRLYGRLEDPLYDAEAEGRERNFARILDFLEKARPAKGRLLDVGAATGLLMNLARRRGWAVEGVEPSAWAVRSARERFGLDVREGVFESVPLPAAACDAVTMVDVIEHTARPADAVARAAEILKPGGILCVVTPDVRSAAARLAGRRWWHFRPAHLSYFCRRSLDALLARGGFRVFARRRYAWTFSAHYLVSRLPATRGLLRGRRAASLLRRISIKLALGDSFEIYARKD